MKNKREKNTFKRSAIPTSSFADANKESMSEKAELRDSDVSAAFSFSRRTIPEIPTCAAAFFSSSRFFSASRS